MRELATFHLYLKKETIVLSRFVTSRHGHFILSRKFFFVTNISKKIRDSFGETVGALLVQIKK